jgi:hypothetical protein
MTELNAPQTITGSTNRDGADDGALGTAAVGVMVGVLDGDWRVGD